MIEINGKQYKLVDLTARKYQSLMDRMQSELGEDWQGKGGLKVSVIMLSSCLKSEDGAYPSEDDLWDLPIRTLNTLGGEALEMNGMVPAVQSVVEKN